MAFANMLSITNNTFLSMLIWVALMLAALYFARRPFHRAVGAVSKILYNSMRLAAAFVLSTEKRLARRNREVLMATGREQTERAVEREFERINTVVSRDLEAYPHIHRQLSEIIAHLDEDYTKSADVPPSLPDWLPIINSIAKIDHTGDTMVPSMLAEINRTLNEQQKTALDAYRNSSATRHATLNKMLPLWRRVQKNLNQIQKSIEKLYDRARSIDRYMDQYTEVTHRTDKAHYLLNTSATTRFFAAAFLLIIASGIVLVNYHLIAYPMTLLVTDNSTMVSIGLPDIFALAIIFLEITTGIFLLESLRVTRLFPIIAALDDRARQRMVWTTLAMVLVLAGLVSALAFIHGQMVYGDRALVGLAAEAGTTQVIENMLPPIGLALVGFLLPLALVFAAVPLESFILSSRTIAGIVCAAGLRLFAFGLRLIGNTGVYIGKLFITVYDLIIFPAIWLESIISGNAGGKEPASENQPISDPSTPEETTPNHDRPAEFRKQQKKVQT